MKRHIHTIHENRKEEYTTSEQLENIAEYCTFESDNSWAKTNIKKECITENSSTEFLVQKSKNFKLKKEITNENTSINSMSKKIQIKIKEEKIIKKEIPT